MFYQNTQWQVTGDGLSCLDGSYCIDASRLTEACRGRYDWPEHMSSKCWVDLGAFCKAYAVALSTHAATYDTIMLADCVSRAFKQKSQSVRYSIIAMRMKPDNGVEMTSTSCDNIMAVGEALDAENAALRKYRIEQSNNGGVTP